VLRKAITTCGLAATVVATALLGTSHAFAQASAPSAGGASHPSIAAAPAGVLLAGITMPRQDDWGDDYGDGGGIYNENQNMVGSPGGTQFG
jgi:UDP-N-acetyl-D-mannosaminuronic acid transferase (WecB/TagA/CpsF family)